MKKNHILNDPCGWVTRFNSERVYYVIITISNIYYYSIFNNINSLTLTNVNLKQFLLKILYLYTFFFTGFALKMGTKFRLVSTKIKKNNNYNNKEP